MSHHNALKNRILPKHYYLPSDLERQVAAFGALQPFPLSLEPRQSYPANVYFGRAQALLLERERIKRQTIVNRRLQHQLHAA
jgi:putative transposase